MMRAILRPSGIISVQSDRWGRRRRAERRLERFKPYQRKSRFVVTKSEWSSMTWLEHFEIETHALYHGYKDGVEILTIDNDERLYSREPHCLLQVYRRAGVPVERSARRSVRVVEHSDIYPDTLTIETDRGDELYSEARRGSAAGEIGKIAFMIMLILGVIAGIQFLHLMGDGLANFPKELAGMLGLIVVAVIGVIVAGAWRGR